MDTITEKQKEFLNHFKCERLISSRENMCLLSNVSNARNSNLVRILQQNGWNEDLKGETAYFVIKNENNEIILFFALKAGVIFNPINRQSIEQSIEKYREALLSQLDLEKEQRVVEYGSILNYRKSLKTRYQHKCWKKRILGMYNKDCELNINKCDYRVKSTFSGIELVLFCKNENVDVKWCNLPVNKKLCTVLFWYFVVPIILEIKKYIGCLFLYLFAADSTDDMTLIRYYEECLGFCVPTTKDNLGSVKPIFDLKCHFMYQSIQELQ